jgi:hypothetical protein
MSANTTQARTVCRYELTGALMRITSRLAQARGGNVAT